MPRGLPAGLPLTPGLKRQGCFWSVFSDFVGIALMHLLEWRRAGGSQMIISITLHPGASGSPSTSTIPFVGSRTMTRTSVTSISAPA